MNYSMTGFGKGVSTFASKKITVEVRSLNSKSLDLNMRMPSLYREKELEMRNIISAALERGKVDVSISLGSSTDQEVSNINASLVESYVDQLKKIASATGVESDYLAIAMRMPDVMKPEQDELSPEEWTALESALNDALAAARDFRANEGAELVKDLLTHIQNIRDLLNQVPQYEEQRMITVRERLMRSLEGLEVDSNRFEQELIFYLEKLDITEEKVRLSTHLNYFEETIEMETPGKKLGFISQEIGREINTLGSKANHAELQRIVVQMKDSLEKIKEQSLNLL